MVSRFLLLLTLCILSGSCKQRREVREEFVTQDDTTLASDDTASEGDSIDAKNIEHIYLISEDENSLSLAEDTESGDSNNNTGAIVGGTLGGVAVVAALGALGIYIATRGKGAKIKSEPELNRPSEVLNKPPHEMKIKSVSRVRQEPVPSTTPTPIPQRQAVVEIRNPTVNSTTEIPTQTMRPTEIQATHAQTNTRDGVNVFSADTEVGARTAQNQIRKNAPGKKLNDNSEEINLNGNRVVMTNQNPKIFTTQSVPASTSKFKTDTYIPMTKSGSRPLFGSEYGTDLSKAPLSDHQPLAFTLDNGKPVGTWNVMVQMNHNGSYSNAMFKDKAKPFTREFDADYEARLTASGNEVKKAMQSNDVFFLQEFPGRNTGGFNAFRNGLGKNGTIYGSKDAMIVLKTPLTKQEANATTALNTSMNKHANMIGTNNGEVYMVQQGKTVYVSVHAKQAQSANVMLYLEELAKLKDQHGFTEIVVGGDFNRPIQILSADAQNLSLSSVKNATFHTSSTRMAGGTGGVIPSTGAIDGIVHITL